MDKNDKTLAVELTSSYITALMNIKDNQGENVYTVKVGDVITALNKIYTEIKELD